MLSNFFTGLGFDKIDLPLFGIGLLGTLLWRLWHREKNGLKVACREGNELKLNSLCGDLLLGSMLGVVLILTRAFLVGAVQLSPPANPNTDMWTVFGILVAILTFMVAHALNLARGLAKETKGERERVASELKTVKKASKKFRTQQKELQRRNELIIQRLNLSNDHSRLYLEEAILNQNNTRMEALGQLRGLFQVDKPKDILKQLYPIIQEENVRNELSSDDWKYLINLRDFYRDFPESDIKGEEHSVKNQIDIILVYQKCS